jgi:kinesin family protein 5
MESIQDLLAPEKTNIPINEDPRTGEVSVPGATIIRVQDLDHFLQLLQVGEANRHAANTKMNTESSRSHAILMVDIFPGFLDLLNHCLKLYRMFSLCVCVFYLCI